MSKTKSQRPKFTAQEIAAACHLSEADIAKRVSPVLRTPSAHQMEIFKFFLTQLELYISGKPNTMGLLVKAVAGSGKTTTIVALAHLIPTKLNSIFLAFNKAIAVELKNRLPKHVEAKTLNSLGWKICKGYADDVAGRRLSFDDVDGKTKLSKITRRLYDWKTNQEYGADVRWLVGMCQSLGIVPSELVASGYAVPANGLTDDNDTLNYVVEYFDRQIPVYSRAPVFQMAREVLTESLKDVTSFSFNEQKYFPVVLREDGERLAHDEYDIVIIDEVQDVNAVDIGLVELVLKDGGMAIGVGDNRQSIYVFRGADNEATEKFGAAFNAEQLPLTISYRCSRAVIDHARNVYPEIEAAPNAPEGSIQELGEYGADTFEPRGDDMVICRNNAPIITFAYRLIGARVPVFVKGRDIGTGLIDIIKKLDAVDVRDLASKLNIWCGQQEQIILDNDPDDEAALQRIADKVASIMVFIRHNGDGLVESVIADIQDLFNTKGKDKDDAYLMKNAVVLSTIHKAKGLEAQRVFIMDDHLMYPGFIKPGSPQEAQEKNLEYVAITRAKMDLVYIDSRLMK